MNEWTQTKVIINYKVSLRNWPHKNIPSSSDCHVYGPKRFMPAPQIQYSRSFPPKFLNIEAPLTLFFDQTLIFHNDKQIDRSILSLSLSVSFFFSFHSITESWLHQLQLGFLLEPLHCFFFCWWLSTSAGLSTGSSLQPFTTFDTTNKPSNKVSLSLSL